MNACDADLACNVYNFDGHANTCMLNDSNSGFGVVSDLGDAYGVYAPNC